MNSQTKSRINLVVFSSLFPNSVRPNAGLFVRERMFRMKPHANITVISPIPWFPGQGIIRLFRPNYRLMPAKVETQDGIQVYFPRFLSFPVFFRSLDAKMMAFAAKKIINQLNAKQKIDLIDCHFTYPDGLAGTSITETLNIPSTITMRGTEIPHAKNSKRLKQLLTAWGQASHIISVSQSLKDHAVSLGVPEDKITVVGNGIDTEKFIALPKVQAKKQLDISPQIKVLITVGGLVPRKGFHRVIECLPELKKIYPDILYLIVGGPSLEGDMTNELIAQVDRLGLNENVRFCGPQKPQDLHKYLSAADLFVLSTANEGWANVLLESLSCGTPVVATDIGGNKEVINSTELGYIVPFNNHHTLLSKIDKALEHNWNSDKLTQYAVENHWNKRISLINTIFNKLMEQ